MATKKKSKKNRPSRVEDRGEGRPELYRPEYCDQVIKHMSQGFSVESFGGVVSVSKKTVYNWMDAHPEFLHAVQKGQQKCRLFWEAVGVRGTVGKINGFRERSWTVNMVNRFAWKQRVEHSGEIEHKGLSGGKLGKIMKNPKAAEKVLELAEMLAEDDDEE